MRRRWSLAVAPLLALGLVALLVRAVPGEQVFADHSGVSTALQSVTPDPIVVRADASGVVLQWQAPAYDQRWLKGADGQPYVLLEAPGWMLSEEPGRPQLPYASALVVVPPEADLSLSVGVVESEVRPLAFPVLPAGQLAAEGERAWAFD